MYPKWYQLMEIYIVAYHRRALCDKKEQSIPGVEGDREARDLISKGGCTIKMSLFLSYEKTFVFVI